MNSGAVLLWSGLWCSVAPEAVQKHHPLQLTRMNLSNTGACVFSPGSMHFTDDDRLLISVTAVGSVPRLGPPKTETACSPNATWECCISSCKCKFSSILWMFDLNEGYRHSHPKLGLTSYINCSHNVVQCDKICFRSLLFSQLDMLARRLKWF